MDVSTSPHRLRSALIGFACVLMPAGQTLADEPASADPITVALDYSITVGHLPAAGVEIIGTLAGDRYTAIAKVRSRGAFEPAVRFRSAGGAVGIISGGAPLPVAYSADNRWMGSDRTVRLSYGSRELTADVHPSAEEDEREVVSEVDRAGTIDPISAGLALMLGAVRDEPCAMTARVFDGRRRYDLAAEDAGREPISLPEYEGETQVCRVAYVRLGGRSLHPWWPPSKEPKAGTLWFAPVDSRIPPIVVRITASAGALPVVVKLKKLEISAGFTGSAAEDIVAPVIAR